jgi:phenylacetate-CoA ligase
MTAGGVTRKDVVQVAVGYSLGTRAFGLHYGAERVGASVVPASSEGSERQVKLMKDFRTTALACTPSYAIHLSEVMGVMGVGPDDLALRVGLFGGEPWSEGVRRELEARLHTSASDSYGLSEVMGPGVSGECLEKERLHIFEDHLIPEIVEPETGESLGYGEQGELVLTTITKEALPLLRYRTRDICRLDDSPCKCGRTQVRMSRVSGRMDDMLIIRGVNVFPSQVETALLEVDGTEPHYQLVISKNEALDELEVRVEVSESVFFDEMKRLEELRGNIRRGLESVLGLSPRVTLVEPGTIERSTGNAKRVLDMRR